MSFILRRGPSMEAKGEAGYKRWQVMFVCGQVSVFLSHTHEAVVET